MSKRYQDGFFKLCRTVIESHESISINGLAAFFEVARSTMQDGIKRVEGQIVTKDEVKRFEPHVVNFISWFFDDSGNPITSHLPQDEVEAIYQLESETEVEEDPEEFTVDDEVLAEKFDGKIREENQKREDESLADYVSRLARQKQRNQDITRVERTMFRNTVRACNVVEELNTELINVLNERRDALLNVGSTKVVTKANNEKVGVIQVSDIHFGELVKETLENRYDMTIASKRIQKFIHRAKVLFEADGITNVAVFMTGDMINSTRRISEITTYADARTKVVFNAYLIIGNMLEDLATDYNITVAHVVGNESRLSEYFDTTNYLVSDNFDLLLYQMLKHTHERKGVSFIFDRHNPMEQVVDVNGTNFLLVHGNGHRGLAQTGKIESEVEKLKARYANSGIMINYVICGHIHSTYVGNNFARSASTVGSNAFAERTLNFTSKASQNLFVVDSDGSIDGYMIDLQNHDGYDGYAFDEETVMYANDNISDTSEIVQKMIL